MNPNIYKTGAIAIPIKKNEGFSIDPQPNFLVIHDQSGRYENMPFENPLTRKVEEKTCAKFILSIEYRTEFSDGSLQSMPFPMKENHRYIPIGFVGILESYQTVLNNKAIVNSIFALLDFEDGSILSGFKVELDTEVCQKIIDNQ